MRTWTGMVLAVILLLGLSYGEVVAHGTGAHTHAGEERLHMEENDAPDASDVEPAAPGNVERMLNARLRALEQEVRKLRKAAERPGLGEIVGGLGWIAGLAALAYAWKRRGRG